MRSSKRTKKASGSSTPPGGKDSHTIPASPQPNPSVLGSGIVHATRGEVKRIALEMLERGETVAEAVARTGLKNSKSLYGTLYKLGLRPHRHWRKKNRSAKEKYPDYFSW